MKILVLQGSLRPKGSTAPLVQAFVKGASQKGRESSVVEVLRKKAPRLPGL